MFFFIDLLEKLFLCAILMKKGRFYERQTENNDQ